MRGSLFHALLLSLAVAILAPAFGYPVLTSALWVWILVVPVLVSGVAIVQRYFGSDDLVDGIIRLSIIALAIVVATGLALGTAGWATRGVYGVVLWVLAGCAFIFLRRRAPEGFHPLTLSPSHPFVSPSHPLLVTAAIALTSALLIFIVGHGLAHGPLTAYDALSYHLHFPARWLQDHRLSIIATPFSDEAQAYAPANGELYFLWLMVPIRGDLIARVGQIPFYLLTGVLLFALARRAGARSEHAIYPALFFFVSRPVVEQAVGSDVDLICWSLFLATIYFGLIASERNRQADWFLWGMAAGLYFGTKYVALVYAPIVLLFAVLRGLKLRMLWALPGLLAFALPWYLRNWLVAGSPIYPASLAIGGITLADGAYSRVAMSNSVFHTTDVRLFPVMAAHAFGVTTILAWVPLAILGIVRLARRNWAFLVAPAAMCVLYWFGVPDNIDSRFLLPAAMLALLPLAFVFTAHSRWNAALHAICGVALAWVLIGRNAEIPAELPWFMGGWLNLFGLVTLTNFGILIGLAVAIAALCRIVRQPSTVLLGAPVVALLAGALFAGGARSWCGSSPCNYLRTTSIFLRPTFLDAWTWTDAHVASSTIAYTGNNVPYPLTGPRLTNRVLYINIDRHRRWLFHDYARAALQRGFPAPNPAFATSSGMLRPAVPGPVIDAVRPRFERLAGDRGAWLDNLKAAGVQHLLISALSAYELDYNWHSDGGFPIEDDWARGDPVMFRIVYENPQIRLYAVGESSRRP